VPSLKEGQSSHQRVRRGIYSGAVPADDRYPVVPRFQGIRYQYTQLLSFFPANYAKIFAILKHREQVRLADGEFPPVPGFYVADPVPFKPSCAVQGQPQLLQIVGGKPTEGRQRVQAANVEQKVGFDPLFWCLSICTNSLILALI